MKRMIFAILLISVLSFAASAQTVNNKTFKSMIGPGLSFSGLQTSGGIYDQLNNRCWGNTFALRGSGEWFTAHLTVSTDYMNGIPDPKGNTIIIGTWTMTLFKEDEYFATVYGWVTEGYIEWAFSEKTGAILSRDTWAKMVVVGDLDGPGKVWDDPNYLEFRANTIFGNKPVTTATLTFQQ